MIVEFLKNDFHFDCDDSKRDIYKIAEAFINIRLGIQKTNKVNTFKIK